MRTAAVAAFVALAVAAAGFSLQAAGLRPTPPANAAAARAATLLLRYRLATSTLSVGADTVRGRCFHGWFESGNEHSALGTILMLSNGASVQSIDSNPSLHARGLTTLLPISALELAGCTRFLGNRIAGLAQFDDHVRLASTEVFGRSAYAVRFRRLTLLVSPKTDRPLGVSIAGALSSIRLSPMTARLTRSFENRE